ncbi:MAG TPA: hypothetical protein PKZ33_01300, partial [Brevefilum sp.]|nr:hypothetical protein [Brevefilum sp.]
LPLRMPVSDADVAHGGRDPCRMMCLEEPRLQGRFFVSEEGVEDNGSFYWIEPVGATHCGCPGQRAFRVG